MTAKTPTAERLDCKKQLPALTVRAFITVVIAGLAAAEERQFCSDNEEALDQAENGYEAREDGDGKCID